jgi:hypothetical protein
MPMIHIVDERAPYLLVGRDDDQFAVVERRAGKLYPLHGCGRREPEPLSDMGAEHAIGRGWCTESTAPGCSRRSLPGTERWPRPLVMQDPCKNSHAHRSRVER